MLINKEKAQKWIKEFNVACKELNYDYYIFPLASEEFEAILNPELHLTVDKNSDMYVLISDKIVSFFWDEEDVVDWIDDILGEHDKLNKLMNHNIWKDDSDA